MPENSPPRAKAPADSEVTLNQLMMPEHSNGHGNVHGGIIMKLVDETAAIAAMRHAQRPVVTIAIDSMTFREPARVSDLVTGGSDPVRQRMKQRRVFKRLDRSHSGRSLPCEASEVNGLSADL